MIRSDLAPGYAATQACHAAVGFAIEHPALAVEWERTSSTLVMLSTDDLDLAELVDVVRLEQAPHFSFHEPDLGDALTAVALFPTPRLIPRLRRLPLLLQDTREEVNR